MASFGTFIVTFWRKKRSFLIKNVRIANQKFDEWTRMCYT